MRIALVVSRYYREIVDGLERGAREYLGEQSITIQAADVFEAPGAFEIPLISQEVARTGRYAGVVCLGCVIQGDTAHFDLISESAAQGILQASLATRVPIAFGVLTVFDEKQATQRSRPGEFNKGREAAAACYQAARVLGLISGQSG